MSDVIAYEAPLTPAVLESSRNLLTSAFVKSLNPVPVPVAWLKVYGNGTVDVS